MEEIIARVKEEWELRVRLWVNDGVNDGVMVNGDDLRSLYYGVCFCIRVERDYFEGGYSTARVYI